jgi:hydroxymethylbilane synthase
MKVRLGTRGSELALYQTRRVARWIEERLGFETEVVVLTTHGDRDRERPLEQLGQVGVFTKELERALLDGEIDLAVHSLKDLPTEQPPGLVLAAVPERVDPADLLLVRPEAAVPAPEEPDGAFALPLPERARVGTSSRRRRVQLLALRPDLEILDIRGNVPTRVEKLRRGRYDAVMLAHAGLDRLQLDLSGLLAVKLPLDVLLPAPGQGALAIEARSGDPELLTALSASVHDPAAAARVTAERRLLRLIEGGCSVPLGTHAVLAEDGSITLAAALGPIEIRPGRPRVHRALTRAAEPEAVADLAFRVLRPHPALASPPASLPPPPRDPPTPFAGESALPRPPPLSPADAGEGETLDVLKRFPSPASTGEGSEVRPDDAAASQNPALRDALSGQSVLILRALEDSEDLVAALQAAGARARCEEPIELRPLLEPEALRRAVEALPEGLGWVLVASPGAARLLASGLRQAGLSPAEAFRRRRAGAMGPGTAEALAREGVPIDLLAEESTGSGLARAFLALGLPPGAPVLLPAARDGRPELREALLAAGHDVRALALYETRSRPVPAVAARNWDAIVLASPSGAAALPGAGLDARLIAIGPTTAAALQAVGHMVAAVAARPTPDGLLEALAKAVSGRAPGTFSAQRGETP